MNLQAIFSTVFKAGFLRFEGKSFKTSDEQEGLELFFSTKALNKGNSISIINIGDKFELEIWIKGKVIEFDNLDENQLMLELQKI